MRGRGLVIAALVAGCAGTAAPPPDREPASLEPLPADAATAEPGVLASLFGAEYDRAEVERQLDALEQELAALVRQPQQR